MSDGDGRHYAHLLSFPEQLWLEFFREFFCQEVLLLDEDGTPIRNNFRYMRSYSDQNKGFDVLLENNLKGANPNTLPCLVIEDLGAASLNLVTDRQVHWSLSPQRETTRSDLIRHSYVFHCCSRDRGESRLMASTVATAITAFYTHLRTAGFHKIEPWAIGKTIPIKSDVTETFLDTPVSISFETQHTWRTVRVTDAFAEAFCLVVQDPDLVRYTRLSMSIIDPSATLFINASLNAEETNVARFVNTSTNIVDPLSDSRFVNGSMEVADPLSEETFIRTSMRVTS